MEHITLFRRKDQKGNIRLRFRLQDTERGVDAAHPKGIDLYHKSDIFVDVEREWSRLNPDGTIKDGVPAKYKQMVGPKSNEILAEIEVIKRVYATIKEANLIVDSKQFHKMIEDEKHPERAERSEDETLLGRFRQFYEQYKDNSPLVFRDYKVIDGKLERYLKITKREVMLPKEFSVRDLEDFHRFMVDEYKYVTKPEYRQLYECMTSRNIPKQPRSQNTVATEIKKLRTFFKWYAAQHDDYGKTPFERMSDTRRKELTNEDYAAAVCLTKDEFLKVLNMDVPPTLQETKDVFLLQCNFGARIEDFRKRSMEDVMVDANGIPYLRYLPHKTLKKSKDDIETPILRYSLDIIKKYRFNFPILKYITGHNGYNHRIKELLKYCGIDRGCKVYNADNEANDVVPLWERASSKLCRKTFVDMMVKAQIDEYAAGLHKRGSEAVKHYTNMTLQDRFKLMCFAFDQPIYAVDKNLNVVEVERNTVEELQRKAEALRAKIAERTATMPTAPETMDDFKAWSQAMAEVNAYNQQLNEINARIIEELKQHG